MPPREPSVDVDVVAFGEQLRRRRKELALTQEDLAELTGLTRIQIQTYERGATPNGEKLSNPTLSSLALLSRALRGRMIIDLTTPSVVVEFEARDPERPADDASVTFS